MFEMIKFASKAAISDKKGVTALEYALIAAAVVSIVLVAYNTMFNSLNSYITAISFGT